MSEWSQLEAMVKGSCPVEAQRASIVLGVAVGGSFKEVAFQHGIHVGTVGKWVRRFEDGGPSALRVIDPVAAKARYQKDIPLVLDFDQIAALERMILAREPKRSRRAQVILAISKGGTIKKVAKTHGIATPTARKWLARYRDRGTSGLWARYRRPLTVKEK